MTPHPLPLCPLADRPLDEPTLRGWLAHALHPELSLTQAIRAVVQWQGPPPEAAALAPAVDAALAWAAESGNTVLAYPDPRYPERLRHLHDPPLVIYVKGEVAALAQRGVALVGSRGATPAGCELAASLAHALAERGWSVLSGLARGIDGAAHRGALAAAPEAGGSTVAVMATGADRVYPRQHRELARQIVARGAVITELPLGTPSQRFQFPRRNRLVAALASGVVVVEAAEQSGSLITARLANELGREVFAVPGSVHSPVSRGCHALLRQGARLVETVDDILQELHGSLGLGGTLAGHRAGMALRPAAAQRVPGPSSAALRSHEDEPAGSADERKLARALGFDPVSLDLLLQRTGFMPGVLHALLLEWELTGQLARTPDGRFQRCRPDLNRGR